MPGVLYPYVISVSLLLGLKLLWRTPLYNTQWRGLAELLILVNRQCEGQDEWDKQGCFSHVFFISISQVLTLMLKQGGVVGEKKVIITKHKNETIDY